MACRCTLPRRRGTAAGTPRGEIISFARLVRSVNRRARPDGGASCLILIAYAHASGSRTPFLALGLASSFSDFAKSDAPNPFEEPAEHRYLRAVPEDADRTNARYGVSKHVHLGCDGRGRSRCYQPAGPAMMPWLQAKALAVGDVRKQNRCL
jgi:hypothetical protein